MQKVVQEITVNQQAKIQDCTLKTEGSKKNPEEENRIWDDFCDGAVTRRSGRNVINTRFALLFPGRALSQSPRGRRPFIQSH